MREFTKVVMGIPGPRHILIQPALQNQSFHKTVRPLSWVGATSSMNMTISPKILSDNTPLDGENHIMDATISGDSIVVLQ